MRWQEEERMREEHIRHAAYIRIKEEMEDRSLRAVAAGWQPRTALRDRLWHKTNRAYGNPEKMQKVSDWWPSPEGRSILNEMWLGPLEDDRTTKIIDEWEHAAKRINNGKNAEPAELGRWWRRYHRLKKRDRYTKYCNLDHWKRMWDAWPDGSRSDIPTLCGLGLLRKDYR